jgi:hypothetical protein
VTGVTDVTGGDDLTSGDGIQAPIGQPGVDGQ